LAVFNQLLEPLKEYGAQRNTLEAIGSTDHLSFEEVGVAGYNPIQDYVNYDVRTHHTNMDSVDRLTMQDLKQASFMMASFAYAAAMADQRMPGPAKQ
jgi:carboxypeptidase Q